MSRAIHLTDKPRVSGLYQITHEITARSKETRTVQQIIQSLKSAFHLDLNTMNLICSDQNITVIDNALQHWLSKLLIDPDNKIASLLMPLIAQRFDEYLELLKGKMDE